MLAQLQQTILLQALLGQPNPGSLSPAEAELLLRQRLANMDPERLATLSRSLGLETPPVASPVPAQKVRRRVIGPESSAPASSNSVLPEALAPEPAAAFENTRPVQPPSPPPSDSSWGPLQTGASQTDERSKAKNLVVYLAGEIPLLGHALVRDGQWRLGFIVSAFAILLTAALASVGFITWRSSQLAEDRAAEAAETLPASPLDVASAEDIRTTLRGYYLAESWEDLLPWVREADVVRPMMQTYYSRNPFGPGNRDIEILQLVRSRTGNLPCVYARILLQPSLEEKSVLLFEGQNQSYRIDWETDVVHQFMEWDVFQETLPTDPVPFRVTIQETDYYNYTFSDADRYRSWVVYDPQRGVRLFGYSERDGPVDRELVEIITSKGTGRTAAILKLSYPEDAANADQVHITEIGSVSWMINYDEFR